ncbi:type II toxin-antitoxin system RelE/ParE family toxin [Lacipirellula sp.]|uniref:type II toxin-antitoxin system RelE/ParE family toxin n=1 Tax=Lacipirellula sp. TaxID=2691419 RepID=UPI003D14FEF9
MANTLRFNRRVPDDIRQAGAWYAPLSEPIGERFKEALEETFELIAASPHAMALLFADLELRAWQVPSFPCIVLYRIDGAAIVIEAMWHAASDPVGWRTPASDE